MNILKVWVNSNKVCVRVERVWSVEAIEYGKMLGVYKSPEAEGIYARSVEVADSVSRGASSWRMSRKNDEESSPPHAAFFLGSCADCRARKVSRNKQQKPSPRVYTQRPGIKNTSSPPRNEG